MVKEWTIRQLHTLEDIVSKGKNKAVAKARAIIPASVRKYGPMVKITSMGTLLHEGLHDVCAKLMPQIESRGISLNYEIPYSRLAEMLSFGYIKAKQLPEHVAGVTHLQYNDNFIGNLGGAVTSAAPEIATLSLGAYWFMRGVKNINEKGKQAYAAASAYCGWILVSSAHYYHSSSISSQQEGSEHTNFGNHIASMLHLPDFMAPYMTHVAAGAMFIGSLYIANHFSKKNHILKH